MSQSESRQRNGLNKTSFEFWHNKSIIEIRFSSNQFNFHFNQMLPMLKVASVATDEGSISLSLYSRERDRPYSKLRTL